MSLSAAFSEINYLAVIVAAIVHLVLGLIWFQPKLLGNAWMAYTGKTLDPAVRWLPAGVIGHLLMSLVLAVIINLMGATSVGGGIVAGLLVLVGFIAPLECGELIWEKIPFRLWLIRVGNQLIGLSITGAILAVWR
jgi:hypothetical protein